ncbi:MAG: pectate lyase [Candidatus Brocadiia bacterium]
MVLGAAVASGGEPPLEERALAAMKKATRFFTEEVATHGGYLWRYSEDLELRWGEGKATDTQVWVQPPGTPAVALAYVRAYQATGDPQFLDAALAAAHALCFGQLISGGWQYYIDFGPGGQRRLAYRHLGQPKSKKARRYSVLDDNTTQAALRCLMAVDQLTDDAKVRDAVSTGLDALLAAQLPKGGWPQVFGQPPPTQKFTTYVKIELDGSRTTHRRPTRYWHYHTFNDGVINDCIDVCLEAYERYDDERYLEAARRGGDFILLSQLDPPQAGWAQQYTREVEPAWARRFEPKSVCSAVTVRNIRTLIDLYLAVGEAKYLEAIPPALAWLERSKLPGEASRWARFYELSTNRPLYFTREYELTYEDDDLPTHYSFQGDYGGEGAASLYARLLRLGRQAVLARREREPTPNALRHRAKSLAPGVREVLAALDVRGRWVEDGMIECRTFIRNLDKLSAYVAAVKGARR